MSSSQTMLLNGGLYMITPVDPQTLKPLTNVADNEEYKLTGQTRKIGIELTEENYWYLKDAAYANRMQMKEYLNKLLEADRQAHS